MVPRLLATLVAATLTPQAKNSHLESRLMGVEGSSYQPPPHSLDVAVLCAPPICLEEAHSEEWPSCSIMSPAVRPSSHQISRVSKSKNSTRKEVTAALKGAILRQEAEKRSAATELAKKKQKKRSPRSQKKKNKKKTARQGRSKKKAKSHWCKALMACEALMAFMALMAVDGAASMGRPARLLLARGPH